SWSFPERRIAWYHPPCRAISTKLLRSRSTGSRCPAAITKCSEVGGSPIRLFPLPTEVRGAASFAVQRRGITGAVKLTRRQFRRQAAGDNSYSSSQVKVLAWRAAYLQALGREHMAFFKQRIPQPIGSSGSLKWVQ